MNPRGVDSSLLSVVVTNDQCYFPRGKTLFTFPSSTKQGNEEISPLMQICTVSNIFLLDDIRGGSKYQLLTDTGCAVIP